MHTRTTAQRTNNAHRRNHGKTRKTKEHNEEGKNNQETRRLQGGVPWTTVPQRSLRHREVRLVGSCYTALA